MIKVQVAGVADVVKELKRLARVYPKAFAGALYKLGVGILSESLPLVPREFGVLRASGYVSPPTGEGSNADVEVGYGTVYAVPQHERTDYRHPRGGQAKYLEEPVDAMAGRALELLAKWTIEIGDRGGGWSQMPGINSRPVVSNSTPKKQSQTARLKRAAANVRRRTGR